MVRLSLTNYLSVPEDYPYSGGRDLVLGHTQAIPDAFSCPWLLSHPQRHCPCC